jgi:hypothetical protein
MAVVFAFAQLDVRNQARLLAVLVDHHHRNIAVFQYRRGDVVTTG